MLAPNHRVLHDSDTPVRILRYTYLVLSRRARVEPHFQGQDSHVSTSVLGRLRTTGTSRYQLLLELRLAGAFRSSPCINAVLCAVALRQAFRHNDISKQRDRHTLKHTTIASPMLSCPCHPCQSNYSRPCQNVSRADVQFI